MTIIQNNTWSFMQGAHRAVEERLWTLFSSNAGIEFPEGRDKKHYLEMVMWKRPEVVLATLFTLVSVQELVNPLPFKLYSPKNLWNWSAKQAQSQVPSGDVFFSTLLREFFGPLPIKSAQVVPDALWVIIDPHLMPIPEQHELVRDLGSHQVLVLLPEGEQVPAAFRSVVNTDTNMALPVSALNPFAHPSLEEAVGTFGVSHYIVVGAGPRLFPTIIGIADVVLNNAVVVSEMSFDTRRQFCREYVHFFPMSSFFDLDWFVRPGTLEDVLVQYIESFGVRTDPIGNPDDYELDGGFQIAPFWELV